MTAWRRVRAFGDSGLVVELATVGEAHGLATAIVDRNWTGVEDVVVGYGTVTVVSDPTVVDVETLTGAVVSLPAPDGATGAGRVVEIPVVFDGPDLDEVAAAAHLTAGQVVDMLTAVDLDVAFVGFAPGFGYLVGLPPALAGIARRATPRDVVPGGSVALAGGFAGIYPHASPGGWNLVGRTDVPLFVTDSPPYALLRPGDVVRFRSARAASTSPSTQRRRALRSARDRRIIVEDPGWLSLVEDGGRLGVAAMGVPRGGPADPYALRLANRLVGNEENAAAIEATARGPTLRFSSSAHVAVVGEVTVSLDGWPVPADAVVPVGTGQTVVVGTIRRGLRAYVAVGGGIDVPAVLGSRSSDVLSGLGPGPLRAGDEIGLGIACRPRGRLWRDVDPAGHEVRVVLGPDVFPDATVTQLLSTTWEVGASSDRSGVRLQGTPLRAPVTTTRSKGMATGAVQVPPDGQPIALLCDHATVGGYPVIGTVASADLGVLGQLRPGDAVRFEPVDMATAVRARRAREDEVRDAVVGWYPVRSD